MAEQLAMKSRGLSQDWILAQATFPAMANTYTFNITNTKEDEIENERNENMLMRKKAARWALSSVVFFALGLPVLVWSLVIDERGLFLPSIAALLLGAITIRIAIGIHERRRKQFRTV